MDSEVEDYFLMQFVLNMNETIGIVHISEFQSFALSWLKYKETKNLNPKPQH